MRKILYFIVFLLLSFSLFANIGFSQPSDAGQAYVNNQALDMNLYEYSINGEPYETSLIIELSSTTLNIKWNNAPNSPSQSRYTIREVTLDADGNILQYGDYTYGTFDYGVYLSNGRWDLSKTIDLTQIEKFNQSDTFYIEVEFYCSDLSRHVEAGCAKLKTPIVNVTSSGGAEESGESGSSELPDTWTLTGYDGDWSYFSQTLWETPYSSTYSYFEYARSISDFQHLKAMVFLDSYDVGGYWEISNGIMEVDFILTDSNNTFEIVIGCGYCFKIHLLGFKSVETRACALKNGEMLFPNIVVSKIMYIEVHAWKNANNNLVIACMYKYDPNENATTVYHEIEITDLPNGWDDNLIIKQRVSKILNFGAGCYFKGGLTTLELTSGNGFSSAPYSTQELAWMEIYRRNFWFIDVLYQAGSFLWSMLTLLWDFLIPCLPLLFSVYGFYLLYLVVSCLEDGDFTRLYDHFIRIAQLFVSIVQAIFNAINTIVSHFR